MSDIFSLSVKIKDFKCIGEKEQGFEVIKPINLIIGRNNSGKSTLIDLIWAMTQTNLSFSETQRHKGRHPKIILESVLTEKEVGSIFQGNTQGGPIPGQNHWVYGRKYVGRRIKWYHNVKESERFIDLEEPESSTPKLTKMANVQDYLNRLSRIKQNPFEKKIFKRISAERDIAPEPGNTPPKLEVESNGRGTTNIIQHFINKAFLPRDLVETMLRSDLNKIFGHDANFTDVVCRQIENSHWEIFLQEEFKGLVPLSQSGSGLKTIIIVLVFIILVPFIEKKQLGDYVFCFEELENNLHPALLRRLFQYLYEKSKEHGCPFFFTTHSSVAIDLFNRNDDAQVIHVTHDGDTANCRVVKTYIDNKGILDDLDVKASDLLQSNGIVWVEGPSDRIYFNRWIDLWSDGELQEGVHYQCIFYGGRLLSHLTAADPRDAQDVISMLNVNRNAIILIDSDKRNKQSQLNETKRRMIDEMEKQNNIAWVTKGRQIENYIPSKSIASLLGMAKLRAVEMYEDFFEYMDVLKSGQGKFFSSRKPLLAEKVVPLIEKTDLKEVLDLEDRLEKVCFEIRKWNK
jgi:putative ATP-dependent endonuclease of OLD family